MANPITQTPSVNAVEIDYSRGKVTAIAILEIASAVLFGIALRLALTTATFPNILFAVGAGILFLAFFFLSVFFIKSSSIAFFLVAGQTVAIAAPFYGYFSIFLFEIIFVVVVVLILASNSGRRDLMESLKVRFWRIGKTTLPKAILGTSILVGGLYYIHFAQQPSDIPLSEPTFTSFVHFIEPSVARFLPDFDSSLTVNQFYTRMAQRELNSREEFLELPRAARDQLIRESAKDLGEQIGDWTGTNPDPNAKIPQALYSMLQQKVGSWAGRGENFGSMVFAGLLLLIILGFTWPLRLIIEGIAFFLYQFLLVFGFANIELEGRSREIIVLR